MIVSEQFDDIYFSKEDGLSETQYVFLQGNGLPDGWQWRKRFCIGELGFGTGLNILAAWKLFEETAAPDQHLEFISIEKYPLSTAQIREALAVWADALGRYMARMLAVYPMRTAGFHRINLSPRVTLTLVFDDVLPALEAVQGRVDAWFLDGFAPAKNPDMWSDAVFDQLARLSAKGARLATFTAAGAVRRGLAAAGFAVEKTRGYGRKRDMVVGWYDGGGQGDASVPARVAVMGAGLAGASAAWHLRRAGIDVHVYEAGPAPASGASGNTTGLMNPKLSVQRSAQTDYYTAAYDYALRLLGGFEGVEFTPHGSLHLQNDDDKARRFAGYIANLGWDSTHMRLLAADSASDAAGVRIDAPCMFYPDAAAVSPRAVVSALLTDVPVTCGVRDTPNGYDAVIYAAGADMPGLNLQRVRGQVSRLVPAGGSGALRANVCFGGYITPVRADGTHMCGATFQPWGQDADVLADDHARNVAQMQAALPAFADASFAVNGGWVGFRTASRDRFPVVGGMGENAWVSTAHGSHGLVSGIMAGAVLAAQIMGGILPVGGASAAALGVDRAALRI